MTLELLGEFLTEHKKAVQSRLKPLHDEYESDHEILHGSEKAAYKPDNRIVVNFPKYIVDTMNGYFIGNPVKVSSDDQDISDYVEHIDRYNDQDDNNAELSKIMSIYGSGFEVYYTDENSQQCITYLTPEEAFMIYDDSIVERPMYFVRRYTDYENHEFGTISDSSGERDFRVDGGLRWLDDDWKPHNFGDVPATEFIENAERQGLFEPIRSMVKAYNKAISEKANDVDYFADAYMKVLGVDLDDEGLAHIRDNRIINFEGDNETNIVVDFMAKPSNDEGQEHLLDRLERLIFQISMVANISDENFGASSGIALRYKLQAMSNLFQNKKRKFESGMNRRYRVLFSHPMSKVPADSWLKLHYTFTPNIPANLLEEAQIAAQMEGIVSHETQLSVLSIVDNAKDELERIEEENKAPEQTIVDKMMFGVGANNATTETEVSDDE